MRILRHELDITDYQEVTVKGELLSVAQSRTLPDHAIDLWYVEASPYRRTVAIYVVGTGNPMPDQLRTPDESFSSSTGRKFLGTVVTPSGLVWHVFVGPKFDGGAP